MTAFVIYDSTSGAVRGVYIAAHNDPNMLTNNTPAGCSAIEVDPSSPVCSGQKGWAVVSGVLTYVPPTDAELLAAAQSTQLSILTLAYNNAKTADVPYMGTAFMADDDSQQMFAHALVAYTAVGATPADFYAVDASYNKVPMTLTQLQGLISAIAAQVWAAFQRWVAVKESLASAITVAAVQAIVW